MVHFRACCRTQGCSPVNKAVRDQLLEVAVDHVGSPRLAHQPAGFEVVALCSLAEIGACPFGDFGDTVAYCSGLMAARQ
jgi:hypothetical protein